MGKGLRIMRTAPIGGYSKSREFYRECWKGRTKLVLDERCRRSFFLSALRRIRSATHRPLRIIDVGCGYGWLTKELSRFGSTLGIDIYVDEARTRYRDLDFIEGDIISTELDEKFDVVVASEVIEHLQPEDQRKFFPKCANLLFDNGWLLLTTPCEPVASDLFRALHLENQLQVIENWLDPKTLLELVQESFDVKFHGSVMFYPVIFRKHRVLRFLYEIPYEHGRMYRIVDRLLGLTGMRDLGLYQTLIAAKALHRTA